MRRRRYFAAGLLAAALCAPSVGSSVQIPALLRLADVERLNPNDRIGYLHGVQAILAPLETAQFDRFREGWTEEAHARPSACFVHGVVSHTEPFVRPPDCRQYEKSVDGMLHLRYCWTARRHCPAPATLNLGANVFHCDGHGRRPCNPLLYGIPRHGTTCAKVGTGEKPACRGLPHADHLPRMARAFGLADAFDRFARTGLAPLCEGNERNRALDDAACARLAERVRRHLTSYRAKLK